MTISKCAIVYKHHWTNIRESLSISKTWLSAYSTYDSGPNTTKKTLIVSADPFPRERVEFGDETPHTLLRINILSHDWEGNMEYSAWGWQYWPDWREGQYRTRELNFFHIARPKECNNIWLELSLTRATQCDFTSRCTGYRDRVPSMCLGQPQKNVTGMSDIWDSLIYRPPVATIIM